MRGIVWFRRDLRLHDNPALESACKDCTHVVPLFVFDEPLLRSQIFGAACVNFMLGCLEDLAASLDDRGLVLQWLRGEPIDQLVNAAREWKADVVYWNRDYEPGAIERDRAVQQRLAQMEVPVRTFKDHVVFESEEVRGGTGEPLQRYSAYRARWWTRWSGANPPVLPPDCVKLSPCRFPRLRRFPQPASWGMNRLRPGSNRANETLEGG